MIKRGDGDSTLYFYTNSSLLLQEGGNGKNKMKWCELNMAWMGYITNNVWVIRLAIWYISVYSCLNTNLVGTICKKTKDLITWRIFKNKVAWFVFNFDMTTRPEKSKLNILDGYICYYRDGAMVSPSSAIDWLCLKIFKFKMNTKKKNLEEKIAGFFFVVGMIFHIASFSV